MIALPRSLARRFRAVLRRCGPSRSAPAPLLLRAGARGLCLQSVLPEVAVRLEHGDRHAEASLAFPGNVLALLEGRTDEAVTLEEEAPGRGRASWSESGSPCSKDFPTLAADGLPPFPDPPAKLCPVGAGFLGALHEASDAAAKEPSRYAVSRLLLRGRAGQVVGTDGRQLLVQSGYSLPWEGDVLVPRLAAWGCPDLAREGPPMVGRTDAHVFVRAGPWTFALTADAGGRYPDFQSVIPRQADRRSVLRLGEADAARLLKDLPRLADKETPIALELGPQVVVRAGDDGENGLPGSEWPGSPTRLLTNRRHLLRALRLGFREVEVFRPDRPVACRDASRVYVWMPLSHDAGPAPTPCPRSATSAAPPTDTEETVPMPNPTNNGRSGADGAGPPADAAAPFADPLAEAEAVRGLLSEAQTRLGRLVAALKLHKRQARAVAAAVESLRQLPPLAP